MAGFVASGAFVCRWVYCLAVGNDVGVGILVILVGLIGVGFGLKRDSSGNVVLALGGWVIFLIGVLRVLAPKFFS